MLSSGGNLASRHEDRVISEDDVHLLEWSSLRLRQEGPEEDCVRGRENAEDEVVSPANIVECVGRDFCKSMDTCIIRPISSQLGSHRWRLESPQAHRAAQHRHHLRAIRKLLIHDDMLVMATPVERR